MEPVVNRLDNRLQLLVNTVKIPNVLNDRAEGADGKEKPGFSVTTRNFDIARAIATDDSSTLGGGINYSLDFFISDGDFIDEPD